MSTNNSGAILSWIAVPVSICIFLLLLPGLISMSYHPIAPGIHLIPVQIILAAVGVLACIVLALRHNRELRQARFLGNGLELAAVPIILWLTLQIYDAVFPQSDNLRLTYKGETYAIPRIYNPQQSSEHTSYDYIIASICRKTGEPVYTNPCSASSGVKITTLPMFKLFRVYNTLDEVGAIYDGDVIIKRGRDAKTLSDGSFTYSLGGSHIRFLLDEAGQIERFMHCFKSTKTCNISTRTVQGILTFPANASDSDATDFWRREEARWLDAYNDWKCTDATCDGRTD